jgi:hypothetical protein
MGQLPVTQLVIRNHLGFPQPFLGSFDQMSIG